MAVINETFGFDVGDEVIAATARLIRSRLRGGDTIGRYSSNKFGIVLSDCNAGSVRIAAERFMKAIRETPVRTSACQLSATISIGGVLVPAQAATVQQAASNAAAGARCAKAKRHDCFHAFEPSPARQNARRRNIAIADDVIAALDDNRMQLALQPIVSTKTRQTDALRMPAAHGAAGRHYRSGGRVHRGCRAARPVPPDRPPHARTVDRVAKQHPELHLSLNVSALTCSDHEWMVNLHR